MALGDRVHAESFLTLALGQNAEQCVRAIRKSGVFRTSRYAYESKTVRHLAERIQADSGASLQNESREYIQSVLALTALAPSVASCLKAVKASINARSFKSYLIAVELLFRQANKTPAESGPGHNKEEISEAFSYYYSLLIEKTSPSVPDVNTLIKGKVGTSFYIDKLGEIFSIIKFREAEMLVEVFPYIATTEGRETIVHARDPFFEKSVRLGYIKSEMQRHADRVGLLKQPKQSLREVAKAFVKASEGHFFELVKGPDSRVRFGLPLIKDFLLAFSEEITFDEDDMLLRDAMKSFFIDYKTIQSVTIYKSVIWIMTLYINPFTTQCLSKITYVNLARDC